MKKDKLECGCVLELHRDRYISMCLAHEEEWKATHQRWAEERKVHVMTYPAEAPEEKKQSSKRKTRGLTDEL